MAAFLPPDFLLCANVSCLGLRVPRFQENTGVTPENILRIFLPLFFSNFQLTFIVQ
jgi:hypothetical protein